MIQTTSIPPDHTLPAPPSALSPEAVNRLAHLTREYARLSQGHAGLSAILGGIFLLLVALMEAAGHGWRFTWMGVFSPLPLPVALGVAGLPFLWLGARAGLHRWATERFGLVEPLPEPPSPAQVRKERIRAVVGRYVIPGILLAGLLPIWIEPLASPLLRSAFLLALALALHRSFPRLSGRMDRFTAILLFIAGGLLLSGIQMAAGDTFLAYPLGGIVALALGFRDHRAFRSVKRGLAALQGLA